MNKKRPGWKNEPVRHSLASQGIKTNRKNNKIISEGRKEFMVLNVLDGISATPETFSTEEEAEEFKKEFVKRYEDQGYYHSAIHGRIPLDELEEYLQVTEVR